ncbi:MAG: flagellar basal-body rod protein FlgF [Gammaproteobacteria bacterium]|nr:flagellar basal-body rod protein FlgF [Gammaproteobacteria bacterium]
MDRLLYVAMTGAAHIDRAQTVHANNLANLGTSGFRADLAQARAVQVNGDGLNTRVFALAETPASDFRPGPLMETGRDLDVAIRGEGFFAVQLEDGSEAYTRAGELVVDALGTLRNGSGHAVLGDGGPITLPPNEHLQIGADGSITIQPEGQGSEALVQLDRLRLVRPEPGQIVKGPDGLFRTTDDVPLVSSPDVSVVAGFIESSNVNAIYEMTAILELSRQFELEVKLMKAAEQNDEAAQSLVSVN